MRAEVAYRIRQLAGAIWTRWGLDEVRYHAPADLGVIQIVGRLDGLANRLDPPR